MTREHDFLSLRSLPSIEETRVLFPERVSGGSKEKLGRANVDVPSDAVFSLISSRFVTVTSHFRYSAELLGCVCGGTRVYIFPSQGEEERSYSGLEIYTDIGLGLARLVFVVC